MNVILVSLYNDENYGLRSIHSVLVNNEIDARMVFLEVKSKKVRADNRDKGIEA